MSPHGIAVLASFIVVVLIIAFLDRLLRPGLRVLLQEVTGLSAATDFYLRVFAIVVTFVSLAAVIGAGHSDLKDGARFMEYVWSVASGLQEVFQNLLIVLLVYVGLITVLMAALRRRQE